MRICFISGAYPPIKDGIGDYTFKIIDNLKKINVEVSLITAGQKQVLDQIKTKPFFCIYPIVKKWNIFGISSILRLLKKESFDIVHLQYPSSGYRKTFLLCLLPFLIRIFSRDTKSVVTFHEFSISLPVNKLRQFFLALFSHRVVVTDKSGFAGISKFLPWAKGKIKIIPIGSNIDVWHCGSRKRQEFLKKFGLSGNTKLVSFFGFIHYNKGLENLLEAVADLRKKGFPAFLIAIAGLNPGQNSYHRRIKELIGSLEIKDSLYLTGYASSEDVSRFLSISDICILPFRDGITFRRGTFMAALAHQLPVISTIGPGMPAELKHESNIYLVKPDSAKGLSRAIIRLSKETGLREEISKNMAELSKKFSWRKIAKAHKEIYQTITGRRR